MKMLIVFEDQLSGIPYGGRQESLAFYKRASHCSDIVRVEYKLDSWKLLSGLRHGEKNLTLNRSLMIFLMTAPLLPFTLASRIPDPISYYKLLREVAKYDPDVIISYSYRTHIIFALISKILRIKYVVRPHNIESDYFSSLARKSTGIKKIAYMRESIIISFIEKFFDRYIDAEFYDITESDSLKRGANRDRNRCLYMPSAAIVDSMTHKDNDWKTSSNNICFVGSLDNSNNMEAIEWFYDEVFKYIKGKKFIIAGKGDSSRIRSDIAQDPNVLFFLNYTNEEEFIHLVGVFINPVKRGSGINIKNMIAIKYDRFLICTEVAARGFPSNAFLIAESKMEWLDLINRESYLNVQPDYTSMSNSFIKDFENALGAILNE
ncbi:hypothetical protein IHN63_05790 [Deinococcus sp. 6YEL10]|uniref:hypothetical protein n=1 Tax=Deinococcus sp. 6YEL10 TaxID=2745870 RepID=UPI001E302E73|nr:hypothetical protein [Deinococcus sp. 6YEL10]MCD0160819.1 hypothetical protein [Deinococcus sp. 6YEL10]